jgi:hypothetical protein
MKVRCNLIHNGIQLAIEIKRTLKTYLILNTKNDATMKKQAFPLILQSI